jgi:O-antigen ligase
MNFLYMALSLLMAVLWLVLFVKAPRSAVISGFIFIFVARPAFPWSFFPIPGFVIVYELGLWTLAVYIFSTTRLHLKARFAREFSAYVNSLLVFATVLAIYILPSLDQEYGLTKTLTFLQSLLPVLFVILIGPIRQQDHKIICFTLFLGAFLLALASLSSDPTTIVSSRASVGYDPIVTGQRIGLGLLTAFFLVLSEKIIVSRFLTLSFLIASMILFIVTMLSTGSKGPLIASSIALVCVIAVRIHLPKQRIFAILRVVLLLSIGFFASLLIPTITYQQGFDRMIGSLNPDQSESITERNSNYELAWSGFVNSYFLGIGTGGFSYVKNVGYPDYPHNIILEVAVEQGIFGIACLFAILFFSFRQCIKLMRSQNIYSTILASLMLYSFVNTNFSSDISGHSVVWMLGGVIFLPLSREKLTSDAEWTGVFQFFSLRDIQKKF